MQQMITALKRIITIIPIFLIGCGEKGHIELDYSKGKIVNYYDKESFYGEAYLYNDSESECFEYTVRIDTRIFDAFIPAGNESGNYLDSIEECADPKSKNQFMTRIFELNPGEIVKLGYNYKLGDFKGEYFSSTYVVFFDKNKEEVYDGIDSLKAKGELSVKRELTEHTYRIVGAKKVIDKE